MSTATRARDRVPTSDPGGRRRWLLIDAIVAGGSGAGLTIGSVVLDGVLGVEAWALVAIGASLFAYSCLLLLFVRTGSRRGSVRLVASSNLAWVALTVVVVAADLLSLTTVGALFAIFQGLCVLAIAGAQLLSTRTQHD